MRGIARKTVIIALLIAAAASTLAIPRRDLRQTGQVAGIALDQKKGKISATFELYVPTVDEPIGKSRKVIRAEGATIQECIDNAQRTDGRSLYVDDASVLILGDVELLDAVFEYYRLLEHDHMDLPVFFAFEQKAGKIFQGEGAVLSTELAKSAENLKISQTIRDLMNGTGERVMIRGEGSYEILS